MKQKEIIQCMNDDFISIIIPCYNSEKTLEKCLVSVLEQDFQNIEVVIVDDGSTDKTSEILNKFKEQDSRIKIVSQPNQGVSKSRNTGIENATGKLICFVDSDDWVENNYCTELHKIQIENDADISIIEEINEKPDEIINFTKNTGSIEVYNRIEALKLLLEDKKIKSYPWGKLYKKELFGNISFPEHLEAFEDFFTLFKIFDKAKKVVKSSEKLYHYVEFADSLSHQLTPKRAYHFFLAITEAYHFLLHHEVDDEFRNKILKNQLKKTFMSLKRILRNTNPKEMFNEKEEIRQELKNFLKYSPAQIGIEYYLYTRFYINFPKSYTRFVRK